MTELPMYRRSELEAVDQGCLARYKAIYIDGIDDVSVHALRGIAYHKVKHKYVLALIENQVPQDFELAKEAFRSGIAAAQTPSHLIPEVRQLWDFCAEKFELPLERFVAAEEKQTSGALVFTPDLVLAHPDRNELEIIDDKTWWHSLTEVEAKLSFQSRYYIRHAMARWPNFASYRFTFAFVRFNRFVSVVFTPDELDQLDREVEASIATIEEAKRINHWPAVAGPACTYCELRCPLVDQAITMPKRLEKMEQAVQLGEWVLAAEQMLKSAKKALKQYSSGSGPVNVNGVEWANRPVLNRAYPIEQVLAVLRDRNILGVFEGEEGLTLSHSALSKLMKKFPQLEKDLAAFVRQKTTWRFSARKPGGPGAEQEESFEDA